MNASDSSAMNTFVTQEASSRNPECNYRHEGLWSTDISAPRTRTHVLQSLRTKQLIDQPDSYPILNSNGSSGRDRKYLVMHPVRLIVTQRANHLTC